MNKSTRIFSVIFDIFTGLAGLAHEIAEIMQRNKPVIDIGNRIGAFTIIPNYLITGIIIWIIFIPPVTIHKIGMKHYVCWFSLFLGLIFILAAIISGFAHDIEINDNKQF